MSSAEAGKSPFFMGKSIASMAIFVDVFCMFTRGYIKLKHDNEMPTELTSTTKWSFEKKTADLWFCFRNI